MDRTLPDWALRPNRTTPGASVRHRATTPTPPPHQHQQTTPNLQRFEDLIDGSTLAPSPTPPPCSPTPTAMLSWPVTVATRAEESSQGGARRITVGGGVAPSLLKPTTVIAMEDRVVVTLTMPVDKAARGHTPVAIVTVEEHTWPLVTDAH